jgi:hypothetical protein
MTKEKIEFTVYNEESLSLKAVCHEEEIRWDIEDIFAKTDINDKTVYLSLDINQINLNIKNWLEIENISLKGPDANVFYRDFNADMNEVRNSEIKFSERINDTFKLEIWGEVPLSYISEEFIDDKKIISLFISSRVKFTGILVESNKNKDINYKESILSKIFETTNLERNINNDEPYIDFIPKYQTETNKEIIICPKCKTPQLHNRYGYCSFCHEILIKKDDKQNKEENSKKKI